MKRSMNEEIVCAGFGGQGIMLMGKLLAEVGMQAGHNVTWLPSYGAEVRGGTAHSMIHISDEEIASPTVSLPTACIVMNKPSLIKFIHRVKKGGLLIVNTSMVDEILEEKSIRIAGIPLTRLAEELGNIKVANMIAIGALVKLKNLFSLESVQEALSRVLHAKDILDLNKKAVKAGYDFVNRK